MILLSFTITDNGDGTLLTKPGDPTITDPTVPELKHAIYLEGAVELACRVKTAKNIKEYLGGKLATTSPVNN